MARAKKEKLSLEELLEQALVKEEDQPYEVPSNWIWTSLGELGRYINGKAFKPIDWADNGYPIIRIQNLTGTNKDFNYYNKEIEEKYKVENGDLLMAWSATLDAFIWNAGEAVLNQHIFKVISAINKKFHYYMLKNLIQEMYLKTHGTGMVHITKGKFEKMAVPLPPLAEQKRIVGKIESLFEKLDTAKELAQNALDSFENRKAAILHKAFIGELTAKWREENGVSLDSWEEKKFASLGKLERGRSKHRPRNAKELFGGEYPFIQTGDVANADTYVIEHKQTLSEFGLAQSRLFPKGTLCITIAANIGDVAILTYDCCFPDSVVGFTPNETTDSKYIYYYMSVIKKEVEANAPSTAQKNINLKILNDIKIKVPTIEEQKEMIRIIDKVFEDERQARELCDVIEKIDLMKKAILARAFRGELGTNNPEEESAIELLKEVLKEKL